MGVGLEGLVGICDMKTTIISILLGIAGAALFSVGKQFIRFGELDKFDLGLFILALVCVLISVGVVLL